MPMSQPESEAAGAGSSADLAPESVSDPREDGLAATATMPQSQATPDSLLMGPHSPQLVPSAAMAESATDNHIAGPSDQIKVFQPAPTPQTPSTRKRTSSLVPIDNFLTPNSLSLAS